MDNNTHLENLKLAFLNEYQEFDQSGPQSEKDVTTILRKGESYFLWLLNDANTNSDLNAGLNEEDLNKLFKVYFMSVKNEDSSVLRIANMIYTLKPESAFFFMLKLTESKHFNHKIVPKLLIIFETKLQKLISNCKTTDNHNLSCIHLALKVALSLKSMRFACFNVVHKILNFSSLFLKFEFTDEQELLNILELKLSKIPKVMSEIGDSAVKPNEMNVPSENLRSDIYHSKQLKLLSNFVNPTTLHPLPQLHKLAEYDPKNELYEFEMPCETEIDSQTSNNEDNKISDVEIDDFIPMIDRQKVSKVIRSQRDYKENEGWKKTKKFNATVSGSKPIIKSKKSKISRYYDSK